MGWGGYSSSASERSMGWREKAKRRGCSSRGKQDGDGSGRLDCRESDSGVAFAGLPESSDSESLRERRDKVGISSKHPPTAVVRTTGRSTNREGVNGDCSEYERMRTATCIIGHRRGREGSGREENDCAFGGSVSWATCGEYGRKC